MGGIIRDVLLLKRPQEGRIRDIHVKADYDHKTGNGALLITAENANFRLLDNEGNELLSGLCGTEHTLPVTLGTQSSQIYIPCLFSPRTKPRD